VLCLCRHLSTLLGNKFDHGAEGIVPVLFNLIPNCARVMATSGTAAIRIIIRVRNGGVQEFILCLSALCLHVLTVCFCIFSTLMSHDLFLSSLVTARQSLWPSGGEMLKLLSHTIAEHCKNIDNTIHIKAIKYASFYATNPIVRTCI